MCFQALLGTILQNPLSRPAATLSPHSGERAGRGVPFNAISVSADWLHTKVQKKVQNWLTIRA